MNEIGLKKKKIKKERKRIKETGHQFVRNKFLLIFYKII